MTKKADKKFIETLSRIIDENPDMLEYIRDVAEFDMGKIRRTANNSIPSNGVIMQVWVRLYDFYKDEIYWFALPGNCTLCKGAEEIVSDGPPPWPAHQETPGTVDHISENIH